MGSFIFSAAEVEASADFIPGEKVHTAIPVTGESCQLVWAIREGREEPIEVSRNA